jgi:RimJ/RimL family protein N-acetyltransferase
MDAGVAARTSDADFAQKQQAARAFIKAKVDARIPCVGWDGGFPEYVTINGYTPEGVLEWTHYIDGGYRVMPWDKFGRNDTENFNVFSVEPVKPPGDEREAMLKALEFALSQRSPGGPLDMNHASGMQAYDLWLRCLETGEWRKNPFWGVHHNVACWGECRAYAEAFLRLAGRKLGGELAPLFEEAAGHYKVVRTSIGQMQAVFLYRYPQPPVSAEGEAHATALLRAARDAELRGLATIERIVAALRAGGPATHQGDGGTIRIETKRLVLRPFTAADWRDFQELSVDWAAAPGPAFDKWPTSEEACKGSVQHMSTSGKYLAMCLRESGKVVGLLGINGIEADGRLDIGHVILSRYQDDDHDREALHALIQHCFDTQGIPAVITHNADHAPQLAPLRSLGFTNRNPKEKGELSITREEWSWRHLRR